MSRLLKESSPPRVGSDHSVWIQEFRTNVIAGTTMRRYEHFFVVVSVYKRLDCGYLANAKDALRLRVENTFQLKSPKHRSERMDLSEN
jgi:hypothetical protein